MIFSISFWKLSLSYSKIEKLIGQLKTDYLIANKLTKEKILYLGFVNDNILDKDIMKRKFDFNCLIFGIKNSLFFYKDITKFFDWEPIKRVNKIKEEISAIRIKMSTLINKIDEILSYIKKNISKNFKKNKIAEYTKQKKKRGRK